jgi:phospholipid/cholesterol/gamma-HCH transport system substrate-binding protein
MGTRSSAIKVGLFTFIALLVIGALLIWKSGILIRASGYELIGEFENIQGLLPGGEVRYRGYPVGTVSKIVPSPSSVKVYFWVDRRFKIPMGSKIRIVFDGLIGERYIGIVPNPDTHTMLKPGDVIQGYATAGLADFVDVGTQNLEQTKAILETIRALLQDPEVYGSIRTAFTDIGYITRDLRIAVGELREFSRTGNLKGLINSLNTIANNVRNATDILLVQNDLPGQVSNTVRDIATMSANFKDLSDDLKKNLLTPETYAKIDRTITNLDRFTTELEGIMEDQELKKSLLETLQESRKLFKKSGGFLETVGSMDFGSEIQMQRYPSTQSTNYLVDLDIKLRDKSLRLGVGDRLGGTQLLHVQQGVSFWDNRLTTRFGLFYTKPGIGLDYQVVPLVGLSTELYDLNDPQLNVYTRLSLIQSLDLMLGLNDVLGERLSNYSVGLSFHP